MGALIFVIVAIALVASTLSKVEVNRKLDNYPVNRIDTVKLTSDMAKGVSVAERRRRCVNGYYDKR